MTQHNRFDVNLFFCDWNESQNLDEMAAKWPGVSKVNLAGRAAKLRKRGFDLKNMRDKSSTEEFIEVVNTATTMEEAADALDTTLEHVKVRAAQLRRLGVNVKMFRPQLADRRRQLDELAHVIGYESWRALESAAICGDVEVSRINATAIVL